MGSTLFRVPQARSSALAALGTLQPRAFGSLNRVDPLDSVSNYYLEYLPSHVYGYRYDFMRDGTCGKGSSLQFLAHAHMAIQWNRRIKDTLGTI